MLTLRAFEAVTAILPAQLYVSSLILVLAPLPISLLKKLQL